MPARQPERAGSASSAHPLQTLSEGRNTTDLASIYMQQVNRIISAPRLRRLRQLSVAALWQDLGWDWPKVNRFISLLGTSLVVSGAMVCYGQPCQHTISPSYHIIITSALHHHHAITMPSPRLRHQVRKSLSTFGMRGHTSISNLCNAAQWPL